MTERPPRTSRPESREVTELKQLKLAQPELATAIDMQVALVEMQRRVQARVPLPWIQTDPEWLRTQFAAGRPVVRFADIPLDWTDFRLTLRQTADILHGSKRSSVPITRDCHDRTRRRLLEPRLTQWYDATSGVDGADPHARAADDAPAGLDQVLVLALRPFLARCAEALCRPNCPLAPWPLPVLRMGAGICRDHAKRRPAVDLRPLRRAVVVQPAYLPVLHERRPLVDYVVRDARWKVPRLRMRRLPPLFESVRCPSRSPPGHGCGRYDCHAAAGRGRDAARLLGVSLQLSLVRSPALEPVKKSM